MTVALRQRARAALVFVVLFSGMARSNDAAAEVAAGGVQPRAERRVTMTKEWLFIAEQRIHVEYEFMNDSSEAVSTEVAFSVPPLNYKGAGTSPTSTFDDFRVWVDGASVAPKRDVRALLDGPPTPSPSRRSARGHARKRDSRKRGSTRRGES